MTSMGRRLFTFTAALTASTLAGSTIVSAQNADSSEQAPVTRTDPEPSQIDLLPLLDVSRRKESETNVLGTDAESSVGGYVRFWVERRIDNPTEAVRRLYSVERRTWLQRFFTGRNRSRLLTARLVINRSQVITQTVTLAAASHNSNRRQGENWSSELGDRRFLTPFFRVDQGTTASIEVALSASATIDSDITRNLLSILDRGARLVAPSAPLVTSLTAPRMTESADFVDSSISRLFGQAVAERSQSDFAADGWDDDSNQALATISAIFPMGRSVWSQPQSIVGQWDIRVSEPLVSIFSAVPLHGPGDDRGGPAATEPCATAGPSEGGTTQPLSGHDRQACLAFIGLAPSRVLGLQVGENQTLGGALRGDAGITSAIQRFDNANSSEQAAHELCVLVSDRVEALGLNEYDTAAALWALVSSGGINMNIARKVWQSGCATTQLARRVRLEFNASTPDQPHSEPEGAGEGGKVTNGQTQPSDPNARPVEAPAMETPRT